MKNYNKMVGLALLALGTVSVTNVKALPGLCPSADNIILKDAILTHYQIGKTVAENASLEKTPVVDSKGNVLEGWVWDRVGMKDDFRFYPGHQEIYSIVEVVRYGSKFIGTDSYDMGLCKYSVVLKPDKRVAKFRGVKIDRTMVYHRFDIDIKQVTK